MLGPLMQLRAAQGLHAGFCVCAPQNSNDKMRPRQQMIFLLAFPDLAGEMRGVETNDMKGRNIAGLIGLYIAWLVAAGLLVSAAVQRHPYSFYTLLRWICCPIFAY